MAQLMSKSELIEKLTGHSNGLSKKNVKDILDGLAAIAYKELKKSGVVLVPGLAKFVVIKKPATKAREGINPFRRRR
jgi:nucleoid DNA-binding protein